MKAITTFLLLVILIINGYVVAYLHEGTSVGQGESSVVIELGEWHYIPDIGQLPPYEVRTFSPGDIFVHNGIIFMATTTFNAQWFTDPLAISHWATIIVGLEWIPNARYRQHAVVRENGRYFWAQQEWNHNIRPSLNSNYIWSVWREILPIPESEFGFHPNTNIRDFVRTPAQVIFI